MRDGEIEEEEGNDETGEQSAKRKRMDTDDSHDSSTFVHRSRRPEPGLPKRFLDAVMLSEEEGSDSDVWVPRSLRAAQGKTIPSSSYHHYPHCYLLLLPKDITAIPKSCCFC